MLFISDISDSQETCLKLLGHRHKQVEGENHSLVHKYYPTSTVSSLQEQNRAQNTPKGKTEEIEMVISPKLA